MNWQLHSTFWQRCPSLWYALFFLLGIAWEKTHHLGLFVPFLLLCLIGFLFPDSSRWMRLFLGISSLIFGSLFFCSIYLLPERESSGKVLFSLDQATAATSVFHKEMWKCRGRLHWMRREDGSLQAKNLPILLIFPRQKDPPQLGHLYHAFGTISEKKSTYFLKIESKTQWQLYKKRPLYAACLCLREQCKKSLETFFTKDHSESLSFLRGILTGEFSSRKMTAEFNRVGLQHIMAISGFHFSLIATLLSSIFGFFFSPRPLSLILICLLTLYFFFIGWFASVQRAWIMQLCALIAPLFARERNRWNSFGIALWGTLLYEPLFCMQIGFQFSFLITASLLLLYSPIDQFLDLFWQLRSLEQMRQNPKYEQVAYLLLIVFRRSLAITLAAHFLSIPLSLHHFHAFPLLSFLYSLFFPPLVFLFVCCFFVSLVLFPLSSQFLNAIQWVMGKMLLLIYNTPLELHIVYYSSNYSSWLLLLCFSLLFFLMTTLRKKQSLLFTPSWIP